MINVEQVVAIRSLLSPGFNPKTLRNQKRVIQDYTNLLVATLSRLSVEEKKAIDISDACNWITFDILNV